MARDARVGRKGGKAEQGAETRARFIAHGRKLFAEHGYAGTSTEMLLEAASVTRGALYHHFRDKAELFAAVCEALYADVGRAIEARAAREGDAWSALVAGCDAFADVVAEPEVVRVLFLDGPAVLGRAAWDRIERAHGLGQLIDAVEAAIAEGYIRDTPAEPLAVTLNGALNEVVAWAAQRPHRKRALAEAKGAIRLVLDGLRTTGGAPAARRRDERP
ncbi:TetR/AcrR family transcriptional regulator [Sorangium sp. So ce315]|uniref:TetR/AcrR family transcriptional regulator n=1 Tax=Sorangium sp. So ce315 TaxID=3133299 RepID=UPI003F6111DB